MTACLKCPPFQMYGGKWEMSEWIAAHLPAGQTLVLVHGGAGSPLWHISPGRYPVEVLNDVDFHVQNFFRMCREHPEELASLLTLTPYSRREWLENRQVIRDWDDGRHWREETPAPALLELARCWSTVARQSMAGAWGRAWSSVVQHSRRGMASGNSRWLRLPETVLAVAARLSSVQIECMNDLQLLERYDRPDTVFYCDPPYHPDTRSASARNVYAHEYTTKQHQQLVDALMQLDGKAAVSGYDHPLYNNLLLLDRWRRSERTVPCRSNVNNKGGTADRPTRTECLWIKE